jgi:hypothetical protein
MTSGSWLGAPFLLGGWVVRAAVAHVQAVDDGVSERAIEFRLIRNPSQPLRDQQQSFDGDANLQQKIDPLSGIV